MAQGCCTIRRSLQVNPPADVPEEQDELAGASGRSDTDSNEAPTLPEAPTPPLVPPPTKDLFTKFIMMFMETIQARDRETLRPQKRPFKARTPKIYSEKSHMNCYYFCQQCDNYFKTSDAIKINRTPFATIFLRSSICLRWAQHKRRHNCATPITWSEFKAFFRKDLGSS